MLDYLFVFLLLLGAWFAGRVVLRFPPASTLSAKVQLVAYLALISWGVTPLGWGVLRQLDHVYTTPAGISVYALSLDEPDSPPYGFALIATPRYLPAPMFLGKLVAKGNGTPVIRGLHDGIKVDFPEVQGKPWGRLLCVKQDQFRLHIVTHRVPETGCDSLTSSVIP